MGKRGWKRLTKVTDYETKFGCAGGIGILREEVWADESGKASRYNLAFLLPHRFRADNGRVLGFDNAHGVPERHDHGVVTTELYEGYEALAKRFFREVEELRRHYDHEDSSRRH